MVIGRPIPQEKPFVVQEIGRDCCENATSPDQNGWITRYSSHVYVATMIESLLRCACYRLKVRESITRYDRAADSAHDNAEEAVSLTF